MKPGCFCIALVLAALTPRIARAQATPFVPPGAIVYDDIDRLAAAGLIDTIIVGVRPWSEREIARLLNEARRNIDRNPKAREWAMPTIDADLEFFAPHPNRGIDAASVQVTGLNSPNRPAPTDPNGTIDVSINPLASGRNARPLADNGATGTVETFHTATLGQHLALQLEPRASVLGAGDPTSGLADVAIQSGSANTLFGNLSISAGREYILYGQAPTGGLLFSTTSPALDMVTIANDRPAAMPWIFRLLGPMRGTFSVADQGTDVVHPHATLISYHIAALPTRYFEFGLQVIDAMGGEGGQTASLGKRIIDILPYVPAIFHATNSFQFSNKMAGGDARIRIPSADGLELYGEGVLDDFDPRRLRSSFLEDGGYIFGAYLACLFDCGRFGVRAEYHQTGIRYYTHPDYPIEAYHSLLGDPLGPRGLGTYLTLDGETNPRSNHDMRFSLTGAFEVRSGNEYSAVATQPDQSDFHFVQVVHRPGEKRARVLAGWSPTPRSSHLTLDVDAGIEDVHTFDFVPGVNRTNAIGQLTVGYRF